jgi:hypothetical protein
VTAKGYGEESLPALIRRVRANLSYLLRNDRVTKAGNRMMARWGLAEVRLPPVDPVSAALTAQ